MIFVTVGTHEQPFNRLVEYMDNWASTHIEEVVIQSGFSTWCPRKARWSRLLPYDVMLENINKARIVITHGGPSSFIIPLLQGKIPIVVPRKFEFNEHINDHQVEFCKAVSERCENIILVEDIMMLGDIIEHYNERVQEKKQLLVSNNDKFCKEFEKIVCELLEYS